MSDSWLELAIGPASGLIIAISILIGLYKLAARYIPKLIDRHIAQIDEQMKSQQELTEQISNLSVTMTTEHASQTEAMRKSAAGLHQRLNPISDDLKDIKLALTRIQDKTQASIFDSPAPMNE
jgi:seryl-tRNA synthetase